MKVTRSKYTTKECIGAHIAWLCQKICSHDNKKRHTQKILYISLSFQLNKRKSVWISCLSCVCICLFLQFKVHWSTFGEVGSFFFSFTQVLFVGDANLATSNQIVCVFFKYLFSYNIHMKIEFVCVINMCVSVEARQSEKPKENSDR